MVGFPGLGIDMFKTDSVLVKLGFITIRWYGFIIGIGFLLAMVYCLKRAKEFGFTSDQFIDCFFVAIPCAIVGARLWYILFNLNEFKSFFDIIDLLSGGLAIYGGMIGAIIGAFIMCRIKKHNTWKLLDLASMGFFIGQAIGRWGNFFNIEIYGFETSLPWRMSILKTNTSLFDSNLLMEVHPLFLYESLWNVLGFLISAFIISKHRKFDGQLILFYFVWYGLGRGFLEGLRTDEFALMLGNFRANQLLGFGSALVAIIIIIIKLKQKKGLQPV